MSKALGVAGNLGIAYPERMYTRKKWYEKAVHEAHGRLLRHTPTRRARERSLLATMRERAPALENVSDTELRELAQQAGWVSRTEGFTDDVIAELFCAIREAARRTLGLSHYDVQLLGGLIMLEGCIAEMQTGEGKTLTATLPAAATALAGIPVHVITVNDYLAERDAQEMEPVYGALGLSVGVIQEGMTPDERRIAYACNITYCTNKELAFDFLKDRLVLGERRKRLPVRLERLYEPNGPLHALVLRGLHFCVVDEADSVLVDEARTPLIISGESGEEEELEVYRTALALAGKLGGDDFRIDPRERFVQMTGPGRDRLDTLRTQLIEGAQADALGMGVWKGPRRSEELVTQALSALHLFERDVHYLVRDEKVQIIDEHTGRVYEDRSWERGLHQMVEQKEGVELSARRVPLARTSYQRFFRKYIRVSGMTGTASEIAPELWSVYHLRVRSVPTHRPSRREIYPVEILASQSERWQRVVEQVRAEHTRGRPVLVGTRTVTASETISEALTQAGLVHQVLNARQDEEEAMIVARAGERGAITVATNMAGRGTDIKLADGVKGLGGLHVIMTELHDSRRIDRQLFGRAARQGDPGSCQAIVALDDEMIEAYGGEVFGRVAPKAWVLKATQDRAERLHAKIRAELLELDERLDDSLAFSGRAD
ncbi:MAG: preprotein translocase subunit SecA [Gammaproteobacteria bacterium]|jgi:preprotein translocase subunit SecA